MNTQTHATRPAAPAATWWNSPEFLGTEEQPVHVGDWITDRIIRVDEVEIEIDCDEADEESELRALIGEDTYFHYNLGNADIDSLAAK